ncbi:1,4-alpha-glucan branching protein [Panacibacter sp. DH6]|uniref:1,4-alpha-glucan branching protein n=1 Tax=Panacibacter microcysteis TaxID=2793269 RepID=A0A931H0G4_9BACT|nr:alpha-amylase family glycosyl hydrolase [Panacibacter microcysteis]MBG9378730.1 1,4-alpha-glucan branching protein [Panacibacter microcysteis]
MADLFNRVEWMYGSNIYEVNIRQYTPEGTFTAFEKHIPRLQDMGVKILWLMPVTPISKEKRQGTLGSYYACSSYTTINPEFGTLDDFKHLVHAAHNAGMKLIIDWVANHTGWDHHWSKEHPDWYLKDELGRFYDPNGWEDVIDLDYRNNDMRKALKDAMLYWIKECDIDGFRCDMAHLVPLDFWVDARLACDAVKPLFWLAECDVMEYHKVFDVSYAWEWMRITEEMVKRSLSLQTKRDVLLKYSQYPKGANKLFFTSNHDENSWNGTEYEKYGAAAKAMAVFTVTWPGMPLLYSGQELPNHKRLKFFEKDCIEWQPNILLHDFYKKLFHLLYVNPALHNHAQLYTLQTGADDKVLAYLLVSNASKVLVILNLSANDKVICAVQHELLHADYINLFSGLQHTLNNAERFELQAWEYVVYATDM